MKFRIKFKRKKKPDPTTMSGDEYEEYVQSEINRRYSYSGGLFSLHRLQSITIALITVAMTLVVGMIVLGGFQEAVEAQEGTVNASEGISGYNETSEILDITSTMFGIIPVILIVGIMGLVISIIFNFGRRGGLMGLNIRFKY